MKSYNPRVVEVKGAPQPERALARLGQDPERRAVLLHSAGGAPRRFSILGFDPCQTVQLEGSQAESWATLGGVFESLAGMSPTEGSDAIPGPFHGGFLGALSYDLLAPGAFLELPKELAPEPFAQPLVVGGIYTDFLVWDHEAERCWLVLEGSRADLEADLEVLMAGLLDESLDPCEALEVGSFLRETSAVEHRRGVEAVRAEIEAGEIYQANLSHRLVGQLSGSPVDAYAALIAANPVPYAGLVRWPGGALLSASPELLVEVEPRGASPRRAATRPIKGTAPRSSDPVEDARLGAELVKSAKDRAELAMIVDLERNDLGRIGEDVRVDELARLELYASVQHLVADVSCELRRDVTGLEVLEALFPGGSITGAPKLRSMEVIAALEGAGRGFFTGSLGYVDTRGAMAFNILIRSLLWSDGEAGEPADVSLRVGGGITWASEAQAEDEETLHKAASLLKGLGSRIEGDGGMSPSVS